METTYRIVRYDALLTLSCLAVSLPCELVPLRQRRLMALAIAHTEARTQTGAILDVGAIFLDPILRKHSDYSHRAVTNMPQTTSKSLLRVTHPAEVSWVLRAARET